MADATVHHAFVSAKPDGSDATKIRASNWNAALLFSGGVDGEVLTRSAASATGAAWSAGGGGGLPTSVAVGSVLASNGVGVAPVWSATPTLTDLTLAVGGTLAWSTDLKLARDAANVLAQRNSTNDQQFRVYETYTDASNYRRFTIQAVTGGTTDIGTQSAGTGGTGSILGFVINNARRWRMEPAGAFLAQTDNSYDIGAAGANRPRNVHAGTAFILADGVTAPGATVGAAKIYVDTADGDLKVCFGDGTIKTLAVDT